MPTQPKTARGARKCKHLEKDDWCQAGPYAGKCGMGKYPEDCRNYEEEEA